MKKFVKAFKSYFWDVLINHFADFKGRATPAQFWLFVVFSTLVAALLSLAGMLVVFLITATFNRMGIDVLPATFGHDVQFFIDLVLDVALVVPFLAIGARRLHDRGKSGWWQLALLLMIPLSIPVYLQYGPESDEGMYIYTVGTFIIMLILFIPKGSSKKNAYGKAPTV